MNKHAILDFDFQEMRVLATGKAWGNETRGTS